MPIDYLDTIAGFDTDQGAHIAVVDIDNDGDNDIFISRGADSNYQNGETLFYKNSGTATEPNFVYTTGSENPLDGIYCSSLIDGGPNPTCSTSNVCNNVWIPNCCYHRADCIVSFVDVDQDGDLDVVFARWTVPELVERPYFVQTYMSQPQEQT